MTSLDNDTILGWRGRTVRDRDGEKIGSLSDFYLDADDRIAYAGVKTGLFGRNSSIVPLDGVREEDDDLVVPHTKDTVTSAPSLDPDAEVSDDEARALHDHYGSGEGDPLGEGMVRSEEEVRVTRTERVPVERIRIRKVLVDDEKTVSTPVRKEVVRLETDPPSGEREEG